jgi:hypothetical protein
MHSPHYRLHEPNPFPIQEPDDDDAVIPDYEDDEDDWEDDEDDEG